WKARSRRRGERGTERRGEAEAGRGGSLPSSLRLPVTPSPFLPDLFCCLAARCCVKLRARQPRRRGGNKFTSAIRESQAGGGRLCFEDSFAPKALTTYSPSRAARSSL